MMLNEAIKTAEQYFARIDNKEISIVLDAQTHWIFFAGDADMVEIGGAGVKIEKETGALSDFILPDEENFILLEKATKLNID